MICFYHNDLDGKCAGAIVKKYYSDCKMYEINYDHKFPWDLVVDEHVIMVDFCLQPFSDMVKLNNMAKLEWIDHHKSAIDAHKTSKESIVGARSTKKAGCELTWKYFFPEKTTPTGVTLLGKYDSWRQEQDWEDKVLPFQYGMRSFNADPVSKIWNYVLKNNQRFLLSTIKTGESILKYQKEYFRTYCKEAAFETILDGFGAIAVNIGLGSSQAFESVWDENKYYLMIAFWFKKGQFTVSLYTTRDDIDCSDLAKKYGGGGHKRAAGFQTKELPFKG